MKRIEFEGTVHEFPDDFTDADIAKALGGGEKPNIVRRAYDAVVKPVTETMTDLVAGTKSGLPGGYHSPEAEAIGSKAVEATIPQTPVAAGAMIGTAAAGPAVSLAARYGLPVSLLTRFPPLARILSAAAGGEAAGQASGEPAGTGGLEGGLSAAAGETAASVVGKVLRSMPGAKGRIAAADAERFRAGLPADLQAATEAAPGATTTERLRSVAAGPGREAIGQTKEGAVQAIESLIGDRPIRIPSLSDQPMSLRDANLRLSEIGAKAFSRNPLDRTVQGIDQRQLYGQVANEIRAGIAEAENAYRQGLAAARTAATAQGTRRALPSLTEPAVPGPAGRWEGRNVSPRQGVERTLETAEAAVTGRPALVPSPDTPSTTVPLETRWPERVGTPVEPGVPMAVASSVTSGASRGAALWDQAQARYKGSLALLRLLENPRAFRSFSDEVQFNTPALQTRTAEPKVERFLRDKLGDQGYEALVAGLTRPGGRAGLVDKLAPGQGRASDALRMLMEGRGGTASVLAALPRTVLPNFSSRYAGAAPYAGAPWLRATIDSILENQAAAR